MKRVLVLLLTAVVMFAFAGCGSEVTDDAQNEATKESATYQDIFDEYSEQIKTATPKHVDEHNKATDTDQDHTHGKYNPQLLRHCRENKICLYKRNRGWISAK